MIILTWRFAYKGHPMPAPSLIVQTTYAELLERCAVAAFSDAFPEDGTFISKTINDRRYWYFQVSTKQGREQRYVGPETPELIARIEQHKQARNDEKERRALVSTLVRSFGLTAPIPIIGQIISALAKAGIFRLRSVLVGTVAYQSYSAMLGVKLPGALLQTSDVDIAQFKSVSIAMGDKTPPMPEVLKQVDKTFREVPNLSNDHSTRYIAKGGLQVEFLTPNQGPDTDRAQALPALQTDAQPLRFLDFLIHEPAPAVILHGSGIHVYVPRPERYAVHKLILAHRRTAAVGKREKDLKQSAALLELLTARQPDELRQAWEEAYGRGPKWKRLLLQGMAHLESRARDLTLQVLGRTRDIVPGMDLRFGDARVRYDLERDVVTFVGEALAHVVDCAVSREALEDYFGAGNRGPDARLEAFLRNRSKIEALLRTKFLSWKVEAPEAVLLKTADVEELGFKPIKADGANIL
jgi:hypothetical protein